MARRETALLMTVGTGIGGQVATEDLAHGILFSIDTTNPDKVIFFGSELSKKTIESVKKQYLDKFGDEFDYYEFIQLEEIDSFKTYFEAFDDKDLILIPFEPKFRWPLCLAYPKELEESSVVHSFVEFVLKNLPEL